MRMALVGDERREEEDEEHLAELGGLELEEAEVDPAPRAADDRPGQEDEHHEAHGPDEERLLRAPEEGRVDEEQRDHPDSAERHEDHLPRNEVLLVAGDVVLRDPCDRPEADADQRRDGAEQDPVEPADERRRFVARETGTTAPGGRVGRDVDRVQHGISPRSPGRWGRRGRRSSARRPCGRPGPPPCRRDRRSRSVRRRPARGSRTGRSRTTTTRSSSPPSTTFSAVPVLPAMSTSKLSNTAAAVPCG